MDQPPLDEPPRRKVDWSDCLDGCDCDGAFCCDFNLLTISLLLAGRVLGGGGVSRKDRAVLGAIRAYRKVSPRLPTRCRFQPTCSAYGLEAVRRYGSGKGLRLTVARLGRCRPGVHYGTLDPVP